MEKEVLQSIVKKFEECGVTAWVLHCEEGSKREHNGVDNFIEFGDEYVCGISKTRNYTSEDGEFELWLLPYDHICHIDVVDITRDAMYKLADSFGFGTENVINFIKNSRRRTVINTNSRGGYEQPIKDEEGNTILPNGVSGYVVR